LIVGSIYGLSAMGLVLTYKTSGLFNVGHGAVCAAAAFVFYELRQEHGVAVADRSLHHRRDLRRRPPDSCSSGSPGRCPG